MTNTVLFMTKDGKVGRWTAVVHLNFRAGSTFPIPVCTVSPRHWINKADTQYRTSRCNKVDAVRLQVEFTFTKGSERYVGCPCKDGIVWFTAVLLNSLFIYVFIRIQCLQFRKLIIINCGFSTKVSCHISTAGKKKELSKLN